MRLRYGNGEIQTFPSVKLRPYQSEAHDKLFYEGVKRMFLVRPRRAGKEVESWSFLIEGALRRPGQYLMMYPETKRGRKVLWEGAIALPGNVSIRFIDMIPKNLLKKKPNDQEMKIELTNGSVIYVMGADDDPDKVRGMNPLGAVFSEFAFSDPQVYQILMPVFRQNGGWVILQTTYNGMNHAYRYMQEVMDNPEWHCRVDSALTLLDPEGNRYITEEDIDADRKAGMAEYKIQQEYYSVVSLNESSVYFAHELKSIDDTKRIIPGLILRAPVYSAWDIGMNDSMAISIFQLDEKGAPVVINYIENNNFGMEWYASEIFRYCAQNGLVHKKAILPHDGKVREVGTGLTREQTARSLGLDAICVERPKSKPQAIQLMRQMLHRTRFNKEGTLRLIECLSSYSKVFDERLNTYKDGAQHDWSRHGVDSYQTMTLALLGKKISNNAPGNVVYMPK